MSDLRTNSDSLRDNEPDENSNCKDWFAWNQDNVSEWRNMSTHGLFQ